LKNILTDRRFKAMTEQANKELKATRETARLSPVLDD
jgi:hypothetical protein